MKCPGKGGQKTLTHLIHRRTDQDAFMHTLSLTHATRKVIYCCLRLSKFIFEIVHWAGMKSYGADALTHPDTKDVDMIPLDGEGRPGVASCHKSYDPYLQSQVGTRRGDRNPFKKRAINLKKAYITSANSTVKTSPVRNKSCKRYRNF